MRNRDNTAKTDMWTDKTLTDRITTFGYQMAEMGRLQQREDNARSTRDDESARYYANHAETYRTAAYVLKQEIDAQIMMRATNAVNAS